MPKRLATLPRGTIGITSILWPRVDFDTAIKSEQKAISKTRDADKIKSAQQRLALYQ